MIFGADTKSTLSVPPSGIVSWAVVFPRDGFEGQIPIGKLSVANQELRKRATVLKVRARSWFEARANAVRMWATLGLFVNPQSVREGRMLP